MATPKTRIWRQKKKGMIFIKTSLLTWRGGWPTQPPDHMKKIIRKFCEYKPRQGRLYSALALR